MKRLWTLIPALCFAACATVSPRLRAADPAVAERTIVGREFEYTVRRGDSLAGIGAKFAVGPQSLAARNGISIRKKLVPGQVLRVDNRHIVPSMIENGIVINLPQRLLFYFQDGRLDGWYPVAVGQPGSWQTPTGSYRVVTKERDPVWDVPISIQREMRRKGERVRTKVPPGPDNPLGSYWLGLSLTCCGIHGTNAPQSIYTFQTHGCIRLAPEDAVDLFARVSVGTPVEIVYEPVLVAHDDYGTTYVEVHPDAYGRGGELQLERVAWAARSLPGARLDSRWDQVVAREEGIAVPLSASGGRMAAGGTE
jgi:L,D-transpeptidase ErfK/SrfK